MQHERMAAQLSCCVARCKMHTIILPLAQGDTADRLCRGSQGLHFNRRSQNGFTDSTRFFAHHLHHRPTTQQSFTVVKTNALNASHWFVSQCFFLFASNITVRFTTLNCKGRHGQFHYQRCTLLDRHLCPLAISACRLLSHQ